jgi:competence protein ComEC
LPQAVSICHLSLIQLFLLIALFVTLLFFLEYKKYWTLIASLFMLLIFVLSHVFVHYKTHQLNRMVIYADRKHTHLNMIVRNHHRVFTTDIAAASISASAYWRSMKLKRPDFELIGPSCLYVFQKKKVMILTDELIHKKKTNKPIEIDFLVIGSGLKPRAEELLSCVLPQICIAGQGVSSWDVNKLREVCLKKGVRFYSIAERGAFIYDFKQTNP